ncbi:tol-pal system-associated acyl-CoA thioesterase [Pleionea sp. CnH1-48]|uniref:tol-pal system-associated acyl-CoA thioesterase n=1 Tax=Pleionea sp. CnH1-48 TaxID=2954494 RepID=UPI002097BC85|nr:tol-pal system-associated acyl-CoA thioesterase [Pleionea sp. CnH1-48]MCO7224781.1 tol-pal system-associated acyl-CoA thioesterase [Pleionea sp. CnH1-48]
MEFIFPVRVYYEDTDVAGVVYYANYLKFMERGRTEWLRHLGMDQDLLIEQDVAFAVAHVEASYLKPARFNDALDIVTRVVKHSGASVVFEQKICKQGQHDHVYCQGTVKVVCVTLSTMKPRAIPLQLVEEMRSES